MIKKTHFLNNLKNFPNRSSERLLSKKLFFGIELSSSDLFPEIISERNLLIYGGIVRNFF